MSIHSYKIVTTQDGSPSFVDPVSGQTMHAKEGALSETLFIYGEAYLKSREIGAPNRALVVGLGLGYIELVILGLALAKFPGDLSLELVSFETDQGLRENFIKWLTGYSSETLDIIANQIASAVGIDPLRFLKAARELFKSNRWQLLDDVELHYKEVKPQGLICYDPYSRVANPRLWEQEFLDNFVKSCCDTPTVFSSYASNGRVKKALIKNNFTNLEKKGYQYKKESTLAVRS